MTIEKLNLSELGLGDNSQAAVNEKLPRRGAEGRGQVEKAVKAYPNMTQRANLNVCRCMLNVR